MKKIYLFLSISLVTVGLKAQTSVTFSGTGDQYIEIDSNTSADFQLAEEFTVEAWTKQGTLGVWPSIITNYDGENGIDASGIWFGLTNNGLISLQVYDSSGSWLYANGYTNLVDSNWHHVAGVYRDDSIFVFVDGILEGAAQGPVTAKYSGQALWFGTDYIADYLLGEIDDVRFWSDARTPLEIATNKDSCLDGSQNNLVGLWHFEEGSGSKVQDISGNNHTGTLVGMDTVTAWSTGINCASCDFTQITATISEVNTVLTSNETGVNYQWLECAGMTEISGATSQSYTATANGDYAVIVTKNGCSDTSSCYAVTEVGVGITENDFAQNLHLYPNPTNGNFSIDLGGINKEDVMVSISDLNGKLIRSEKFSGGQSLNLSLEEPAGIYLLMIQSRDNKAVLRLIKK